MTIRQLWSGKIFALFGSAQVHFVDWTTANNEVGDRL